MNRREVVTRLRETSVVDLSPPVARKTWQTGGGDLATKWTSLTKFVLEREQWDEEIRRRTRDFAA